MELTRLDRVYGVFTSEQCANHLDLVEFSPWYSSITLEQNTPSKRL